MLVGFDCSKNGTAVCFREEGKKTLFYTYTTHLSKKINEYLYEDNDFVIVAKRQQYSGLDDFEILRHIRDQIFYDTNSWFNKDSKVYIEGYSMGGNGRVTMLAELTSLLKNEIYNLGYKLNGVYAPTSIKLKVGGKGNLKKDEIYQKCWNNDGLKNLIKNLELEGHPFKNDCWQLDVLDSWAVSEMGKIMDKGE